MSDSQLLCALHLRLQSTFWTRLVLNVFLVRNRYLLIVVTTSALGSPCFFHWQFQKALIVDKKYCEETGSSLIASWQTAHKATLIIGGEQKESPLMVVSLIQRAEKIREDWSQPRDVVFTVAGLYVCLFVGLDTMCCMDLNTTWWDGWGLTPNRTL